MGFHLGLHRETISIHFLFLLFLFSCGFGTVKGVDLTEEQNHILPHPLLQPHSHPPFSTLCLQCSLSFYHDVHSHRVLQGLCSPLHTATTTPQEPDLTPARSCFLCWDVSPAISGYQLAPISQDHAHQRRLAPLHPTVLEAPYPLTSLPNLDIPPPCTLLWWYRVSALSWPCPGRQ